MTASPCAECGQVHERCSKHRKRRVAGELVPCGGQKIRGTDRCRMHAGEDLETAKARGRQKLAEAEALRSIRDVVVEPIGNPLDALAELAAEATAWRKHLANVVAELDAYRFTTGGERGGQEVEHLDARVALFERAMDRCQRYLADWVRLGFEERKARLDDARVALVRTFVLGVLADLGHCLEDPTVRVSVERWARVLDGEAAPPAIERGGAA